jgi:hypothetical protein
MGSISQLGVKPSKNFSGKDAGYYGQNANGFHGGNPLNSLSLDNGGIGNLSLGGCGINLDKRSIVGDEAGQRLFYNKGYDNYWNFH